MPLFWGLPAAVFAAQGSAWAVAPALLFGLALAGRFRYRDRLFLPRSLTIALALLLQAAVTAWTVDRVVWAAGFAVATGVVLGGGGSAVGAWAFEKRPRPLQSILAMLLAAFALMPTYPPAPANGSAAAAAPVKPPPAESADGGAETDRFETGDIHRGVILYPEVKRYVRLVPPLPRFGTGREKMPKDEPLKIPFFGVYWFFRPPWKEPPPGSFITRGEPDVKTFREASRQKLEMEARQNLGVLMDKSCCRRLDVAVRNGDPGKGLRLELRFINSRLPGAPVESLGTLPLEKRSPALETLGFAMPAAPLVPQFDEIAVVFHRHGFRDHVSAKVAIERFVLIPR